MTVFCYVGSPYEQLCHIYYYFSGFDHTDSLPLRDMVEVRVSLCLKSTVRSGLPGDGAVLNSVGAKFSICLHYKCTMSHNNLFQQSCVVFIFT